MVEFRCIGHDSRHVCRSLCWRRGGGFYVWVATQLRERSERNKNPPAMRVEDKKLYKKHLSRLY